MVVSLGTRDYGVVYGFITTGFSWRMLRYDTDRRQFLITVTGWPKGGKIGCACVQLQVVDSIYAALSATMQFVCTYKMVCIVVFVIAIADEVDFFFFF